MTGPETKEAALGRRLPLSGPRNGQGYVFVGPSYSV
jgi:hypothetical protein